MPDPTVVVALCGDVMLGRGVDQILPHPGDPTLWEDHLRDARDYVRLAEAANGPVPRPVDFAYPWGDALDVLDRAGAQVRVVNLETSVTTSSDAAVGKAINYRMSPANLPCLAAVRPDCCALANNHVLDFGPAGLAETSAALDGAGLRTAGAGPDAEAAWRAAIVPAGAARVVILSFGLPSSGVPSWWAATPDRSGVAFLPEPSRREAGAVADRVRRVRRPGDIVIASVHWGSNWGYGVGPDDRRFAYALIDGGVDVVHGHSSHHPRPIEVYRNRLILYGCGDLVNDYEGIGGHARYRADLRLLYLASVRTGTGELVGLRMAPLQAHRMRLRRTSAEDSQWLRKVLDQHSRELGTAVDLAADGKLVARPG